MSEEKKVKKERKVAKKREPVKREKIVEEKQEVKNVVNTVPHPFIKHFEYKDLKVGDEDIAKLFYDFAIELDAISKNNKLKDVEFRKLLDCRNRLIRVNL